MTVKEIKSILENVPDDYEVVANLYYESINIGNEDSRYDDEVIDIDLNVHDYEILIGKEGNNLVLRCTDTPTHIEGYY